MRLFVAVWPPKEVLGVLAAIERPQLAGVRWTTRDQWHVTLRFLGEIPDSAPVVDALTQVAGSLSPADVAMAEKTARFGRAVLHVSVTGLRRWAEAIAAATAELGARPDDRAFLGHITLARAGRGATVQPVAGRPLPPGPRSWVASELGLVRSQLGRDGARYETMALVPIHHRNTRSI